MSYITLTDAKAWIAANVPSKERKGWDALQDADKQIALNKAESKIDDLSLAGRRYELPYIENGSQKDLNQDGQAQTNEFPRIIDEHICDYDYGIHKAIVPQAVIDSACLEAVAICNSDGSRANLQAEGVQSFSIGGKLSETFSATGQRALLSADARRKMRKYIGAEIR